MGKMVKNINTHITVPFILYLLTCIFVTCQRMCEFGVGADGIKRYVFLQLVVTELLQYNLMFKSLFFCSTCCKMEVKKGFQWSKCMPASVGGPVPDGVTSCPKTHFGYLTKGRMKIIMTETGEEKVLNEGDVYYIEPNHDAIMMADVTAVEFESDAAEYYGKIEQ